MSEDKKIRFPLRLKMVTIVIALSLMLCAVSLIMCGYWFSANNEETFKNQAMDIARMAAVTVNGDDLTVVRDSVLNVLEALPDDKLVTSDDWGSDEFYAYLGNYSFVTEMPEFKCVLEQLSVTQKLGISTLSSIYTGVFSDKKGMFYCVYLADAAEEDPCLPGVLDHVEGANWDSAGHPEQPVEPYITNTNMYDWLVTTGVPVFDSSGEPVAYVYVDLDMNEIKAKETVFLTSLTAILFTLTVLISLITLFVIEKMVVDPIKKLYLVAAGYISDETDRKPFLSLDIKNSDEIGGLADAMKKIESDIHEYVDNLRTVTAEKERVSAELNVAAGLQADMLPKHFPVRDDISLYAAMNPAKEIGGDFYDFFMIDDDHLGLVIADVSGKGVPAAMFMIVAKTLMKIRTTAEGTPARMLYDVNNTLCDDNQNGHFVTAWMGILTLSTGELISANAGHEYPALKRKGGKYELLVSEHEPPLASVADISFHDEVITLHKGDELFLYTDGVTEARASDGSRFGNERLLEVLNSGNMNTPKKVATAVKSSVDAFIRDNDPFDDITVMSIFWNGSN